MADSTLIFGRIHQLWCWFRLCSSGWWEVVQGESGGYQRVSGHQSLYWISTYPSWLTLARSIVYRKSRLTSRGRCFAAPFLASILLPPYPDGAPKWRSSKFYYFKYKFALHIDYFLLHFSIEGRLKGADQISIKLRRNLDSYSADFTIPVSVYVGECDPLKVNKLLDFVSKFCW